MKKTSEVDIMIDEAVIVARCSHTGATQSCYTGGADYMNDLICICSFAEDEGASVRCYSRERAPVMS